MFKLQFKHNPNRSMWLVGERIRLGADNSNDVVLTGLSIADFHAEIIIEADYLILKSKAGSCYVNSLPVNAEHKLTANDELKIGGEHMLITDPKVDFVATVKDNEVKILADGNDAGGWALIPDHGQLKQRDFRITQRSVIGRSKDCTFFVPYKMLSREHAVLQVENGELWLEDLGSANGSFVNAAKVGHSRLCDGDKVAFAKLSFTVKYTSPNNAPLIQRRPAVSAELNKTMIRPAVDMKLALQRAAEDQPKAQLTAERVPVADKLSEVASNPGRTGLWLSVSAGLLLIAVGWYVFQAGLLS